MQGNPSKYGVPAPRRRLESILATVEGSFRAADLAERDLWYLEPEWTLGQALDQMDRRNIDVAPVRDDATRRFVVREELRHGDQAALVDEIARIVDISHLVTGDVALGEALDLLEERAFLFTIEGDRITGIITPSDVQRVPVSMVVLTMILTAEAGISQLIVRSYGSEEGWLADLSENRRALLETRFEQRLRRNAETQRLDLLMLEDRIALIRKRKALREAVGFTSRARFDDWAKLLQAARDELAHGHTILDVEPDPIAAIQLIRRIRGFASQVWRSTTWNG